LPSRTRICRENRFDAATGDAVRVGTTLAVALLDGAANIAVLMPWRPLLFYRNIWIILRGNFR
jgi:hypothetical protein